LDRHRGSSGRPDPGEKPLAPQDGREFGPRDLDGHLAIVLRVGGQAHARHTTRPELALAAVAVGEGGGKAGVHEAEDIPVGG
jgi:hypothetical protein